MFKVELSDDTYNRLYFKFETLEEAKDFVEIALNSVDKENIAGFKVKIMYSEEYRIEKEGGE